MWGIKHPNTALDFLPKSNTLKLDSPTKCA